MDRIFLAFFDPAVLGVLVPIVALMIPIVAILVRHQQRMAEIIHSSGASVNADQKIEALRGEVAELRQLIHQQMLALDSALQERRTDAMSEGTSVQS